ncbi:hypothetical protein Hdeb2414_s0006g00200381 [Helianthus debilis subsp. tardiflorus]
MTGDMRLLYDVKSIRGGYVTFTGDKGGYITGEGMVSKGVVSFDKINFVQQLDHNLLSVSQICDKKFSVHFDANGCYVLKPGFRIPKDRIYLSALHKFCFYMTVIHLVIYLSPRFASIMVYKLTTYKSFLFDPPFSRYITYFIIMVNLCHFYLFRAC